VRCDLPRMKLVKSAGLQDRDGNRGVRRVLERVWERESVWRGETSGDEAASTADEAASTADR
jgi:hypothetical protein